MTIDEVSNIIIPIFTITGIWLLNREDGHPWRKYGPPLGLAAQPFWLITTYIHGQVGVFLLSLAMVVTYADGCSVYWTKRKMTSAHLGKFIWVKFLEMVRPNRLNYE